MSEALTVSVDAAKVAKLGGNTDFQGDIYIEYVSAENGDTSLIFDGGSMGGAFVPPQ